jgi:hypothetical protein
MDRKRKEASLVFWLLLGFRDKEEDIATGDKSRQQAGRGGGALDLCE